MKNNFRQIQGFSLLELLLTLSIMILLASFILLKSPQILFPLRLKLLTQQMVHHLNMTRVLAIQTGEPAYFCLTQEGKNCDNGPAKQYMVFQLSEQGSKRIIHQVTTALPVSMMWRGFSTGSEVIFKQDGTCEKNGRLIFALDTSSKLAPNSILVSLTGRVRNNAI